MKSCAFGVNVLKTVGKLEQHNSHQCLTEGELQ
jgi:hypothetical protein